MTEAETRERQHDPQCGPDPTRCNPMPVDKGGCPCWCHYVSLDLERLEVEDGDVLVLTLPEDWRPHAGFEMARVIRDAFEAHGRHPLLVVLPNGATLDHMGRQAAEALLSHVGRMIDAVLEARRDQR